VTGERSLVLDVPNESTEPLVTRSAAVLDAAFRDRWNAWRARGVYHDRVARRRLCIVGLVIMIGVAIVAALSVLIGSVR
jgi:hypothetical protein